MRREPLIRTAFAVLLAATLWLPAAAQAPDERALAARVYERIEPMLSEMMKKAYLDSLFSGDLKAFAGCDDVATQLRADLARDTTPVMMELFFNPDMRLRVEDILVDVYDADQLRVTAEGGSAPTRPEQSAAIAGAFRELGADFQQRIARDERYIAAITRAMQNAVEPMRQCRARRAAG